MYTKNAAEEVGRIRRRGRRPNLLQVFGTQLGESRSALELDVLELWGQVVLGVLVLVMLFVGFWIWHLCLKHTFGPVPCRLGKHGCESRFKI